MRTSAKIIILWSVAGLLGLTGWWVLSRPRSAPGPGSAAGTVGAPPAWRVEAAEAAAPLGQFPEAAYPPIATAPLIRVSLELLAKNGADLAKPMPSRHRVLAASPAAAQQLAAWGRGAGFEPAEPVRYHEHGGVEHFQVDLVRTAVPEAREIEAQGRAVFAAVAQIPGTHYQTWLGTIVR